MDEAKVFIGDKLSDESAARLLQLSMLKAEIFVSLIAGQAEVNYHRYMMGRTDSPDSRFCEPEDKTTMQFLCDCEALINKKWLTLEMDFIEALQLSREYSRLTPILGKGVKIELETKAVVK